MMLQFNATYFTGVPDLRPAIHPCVCRNWVASGETLEQSVLRYARDAYDQRALFCADFEPMPDYRKPYEPVVEAKLDEWCRLIDAVRAAYPNLCVGNYHSPWHWRERYSYDDKTGRAHWRGLVDRLNYSAASIYYYRRADGTVEDYAAWLARAQPRIAIAREFDKPVYAFLNPTHFSPPYENVDADLLRRAVDYLRENADAVIWWSGFYYTSGGAFRGMPFNPDDAWAGMGR